MSSGQEIQNLMVRRVRTLERLRQIFMQKQKHFLNTGRSETITLEDQRKLLLNEMTALADQWKRLLSGLRKENRIRSANTDIIISLSLPEKEISRYFAYREQLHQTLSDIEQIKRNTSLLENNAFIFTPRKNKHLSYSARMFKRTFVPEISNNIYPPGKTRK
ncbi:MAG: hypothetical protein EH225_03215 [Calditrichaeota bacterium]|nr:hypothetical protein [Calditrichota bacterium]RQV93547.1 MAG: hypothetical protein EH221_09370 [bacterium]RQW06480.1 MAG: hypothetical protein EH225_03215 [Calditrichota bacterium]